MRNRWLLLILALMLAGSVAAAGHRKRKPTTKAAPPKASDACTVDADCAPTLFLDGGCCPGICVPRAVSKASAEAIEKFVAACKKPAGGCPALPCAPPPRGASAPACVSGHCVMRTVSTE